jgi:hypothetical protein
MGLGTQMLKIALSQKSYFCPKMCVFDKNGPKNMFGPTWEFSNRPILKVDISSFVMMHSLGVCKVGTLNS